jgi:hypothetical protein
MPLAPCPLPLAFPAALPTPKVTSIPATPLSIFIATTLTATLRQPIPFIYSHPVYSIFNPQNFIVCA